MPRVSQKPVNVFNKGLITEAGELTFPDGASVDELNCDLLRDGSRRRRLGVAYETNYTTSSAATLANGEISSVNIWENAGGRAGLNFVVVQLGDRLHFYTEVAGEALSQNKKSFTVDLNTFARPTSSSASLARIQVTPILGALVVASEEVNTFYIEYDPDLDTISTTQISFRIRDFKWQGDRSTYSDSTSFPSSARKYDTYNSSWGSTAGQAARTTYGTWPALTLPWYAGKNSTGNFSAAEWDKIEGGTGLIGNGYYVYDLYEIDRNTKSGLTGLTDYTETSRFKSVVSFGSRVFYAGMENDNVSNVFFSRIVEQLADVGECLQANDPTSENFPDLLDNDGGMIAIPEAYNIRHLHVIGTNLFVFAENGVWVIRGIDDSFRATAYYVGKVANIGVAYDGSFVTSDNGTPYWWSELGIHTLVPSGDGMAFEARNISLPTIQTFFDEISPSNRAQVLAAHDGFNNRIVWMYPSEGEGIDGKMTRCLWLDEQLGALYPWEISSNVTSEYVLAPFFIRGSTRSVTQYDVIDAAGDTVVDGSGNTVIVERDSRNYTSSSIKLLVRTSTSNRISFAEFSDTSFLDWGAADYSSFVEGGYDFSGDLTTKKNTLYLTTYCKTTETDIIDDGGALVFSRPSSCKVSSYWDYKTTASQTPQEAYRLKDLPVPDGAGTLTYPKTVTVSRLRLRGRGRSIRLRFESTTGNDFHLIGYDMITMLKGSL